jgi:hypothetical protein
MDLENLRIASPCPADWDQMDGDERVRFCRLCQKNVYDISAMTQRQAKALLRENGAGICTRIYRREDGTILTQDCPIGLAAVRRRFARIAGAAFSAVLSVTSSALAQQPRGTEQQSSLVQIGGESQGDGSITGKVTDQAGSVVPRAVVTLINESSRKEYYTITDDTGQYRFASLPKGGYTVRIESPGFTLFRRENLIISSPREVRTDATLAVGAITMGGAIVASPPKRLFGWLHKK